MSKSRRTAAAPNVRRSGFVVGELFVRWIKFSLEFGEWFSSAMEADHPTIMQAVRLSLYKAVMPPAEFPAVPA
jgi:hypothetical protein